MKKQLLRGGLYYMQFPLSILFMELVLALYCFGGLFGMGILYTFLFSVVFGGVAMLVSSVWSRGVNRAVSIVLYAVITGVFVGQIIYFTIFRTFTGFYALALAGNAVGEFADQALAGAWTAKWALLPTMLPLVLQLVFGKRLQPEKPLKPIWFAVGFLALAGVQFGTVALIGLNSGGILSYRYVYYDTYSPLLSTPRFGMLTTMRLELREAIRERGNVDIDKIIDENLPTVTPPDLSELPSPSPSPSAEPTPVVYGDNVMDIDFDKLIEDETDPDIRAMHEYVSALTPTKKNAYTGLFEGKNLIWIVAESYCGGVLDETHTPTLWRLAHEGFVCRNFYNPIWYGSTSDGEFTTLTGLLPKSGNLSFRQSSGNYMPFGFGWLLGEKGYVTKAYHDHTYTYYDRDKSHPNLGYDYVGVGNGLEVTKQWPESDVEMIDATTPDYIDAEHFHVYYLTVSGHMLYTFDGNMMARKHQDEVADLPYSEPTRAYIASMMETDRAMELLLQRLEEAGRLEDTVIVFSGDHYPYALEPAQLEEIGLPNDNFELYRSSLIFWCAGMETEYIDKVCSPIDIMPTLANLFGLEYDSRLVSGRDIFSDAPGLVVFNNRSYITDLGRYNSVTDVFEPAEGAEAPEGYPAAMLKAVNEKFDFAANVIRKDYYAAVFGEERD